MKRQYVNSSQIISIGHDPETNTLAVEFKHGGVYHYHGVNAAQHAALMSAPSIGSHFHTHIKGGGFKYSKQ
jgi:hypothetical protein